MSMVYAVANQKGGVGKSTTVVNLGAYLGSRGKRVLCVDIDPQGNTTTGLGIKKNCSTPHPMRCWWKVQHPGSHRPHGV